MTHPAVASLLPVVLLIAIGWFAGHRGWIDRTAIKGLSTLVFVVLTPALLFRTMSTVRVQGLDGVPVLLYFATAVLLFAAPLVLRGLNRRAAVLGLSVSFSNTVMIGIPLVTLSLGQAGLVSLLSIVSLHSLVMLTLATVALELALARELSRRPDAPQRRMLPTVLLAVRNAVIHPVPLPIAAGLLFAQSGLTIPPVIDKVLLWLGNAFGPLALLLVGATLATSSVGPLWRKALGLMVAKNLLHPALVVTGGMVLGLQGTAFAAVVMAAALPIGANVFLFSQRYEVAEDLVTASVALSTMAAMLTIPLVMTLVMTLAKITA